MVTHHTPQIAKVTMGAVIHRACTGCGAANAQKLDTCEACGAPTPPPEYLEPEEVTVGDINDDMLLAMWQQRIERSQQWRQF